MSGEFHQRAGDGEPLANRIRAKGWTLRDAADYLGVSRSRLYEVIANPRRARLWDLAVTGLPRCNASIRRELTLARKRAAHVDSAGGAAENDVKPRRRGRGGFGTGLGIGDVLAATTEFGDYLSEGDLVAVQGFRKENGYRVVVLLGPLGELCVDSREIFNYFAETGQRAKVPQSTGKDGQRA